MSKVDAELLGDAFFGVRFKDGALERTYQNFGFEQSLDGAKYTLWIAALLFLLSAPFDYYLIGFGSLTPESVLCLGLRVMTISALLVLGFYSRTAPDRKRSIALLSGWLVAFVTIWLLTVQAPREAKTFYMLLFGWAALSTASLLPVLNRWQIRAMNALLFLPIAQTIHSMTPFNSREDLWSFAFGLLVLMGMIFFALYSKRSYELAKRRDFLLSRDLAQARDEALQADQAKSQFLASASHELRTPLNAILGNLQLLRKLPSLGTDQEQMLKDAERASRTMTSLVEDVLLISSSRHGADPPRSPIRLRDLVADLEATSRILAQQKSLRLDLPDPAELDHWVSVDVVHLRQILINLMGNAIKFTRAGRVGLRLRIASDRLHFLVHDTGVGMEADQVHRAFDPLFRGTNVSTGEFAGSGLGLSIVRRLVEDLGGYVRLRSRLGQGTCILFGIPARLIAKPAEAPVGSAPEMTVPPLRILVIEDEPTNMYVIDRFLTLAGHSVIKATTGAEALSKFRTDAVDCILSDIQLPDISGVNLLMELTHLARDTPSGHVPIYAVTANVLPSDLERYEDSGFDGHIPKPIEEIALIEALMDVAAGKIAMQGFAANASKNLSDILGEDDFSRLYKKSARECSDRLRTAVEDEDLEGIAHLAHRMRGAALTFGDDVTARMAAKLELQLAKDQEGRLQAALEFADNLRHILRA